MTAVEWLINQLHKKQYGNCPDLSYNKMFEQAKEMEKQNIIDAYEISDLEIEKWAKEQSKIEPTGAEEFGRIQGAKWYREQLKKKQ